MVDGSLMQRGREEADRNGRESGKSRRERVFVPLTDIYETEEAINLIVSMPGIAENSVEVSLEDEIITIFGRVAEQRPPGMKLVYSEYVVGDYQRSFRLHSDIDKERISAKVKDGELRVCLPKCKRSKRRVIPLNVA